MLCCFSLVLLTWMTTACPPRTDPKGPRSRGATLPPPRVHVGAVLRLQRAGVLTLVRGKGVAALVDAKHRASGWQRALDNQGNQFRVSPRGLIVADGEPRKGRQPASVANVAYYYTQAYALMAAGYRRQGLKMAAEILDLPATDAHVKLAQWSICSLFKRLGIRGVIRQKLYRNLVGVAHRTAAGARLVNHVHGFAVTAPLSWRILAAAGGKLSPDATIMAFSLPPGPNQNIQANLLWTTHAAPRTTSLATFARTRLLTTAGSRVRSLKLATPKALGPTLAYTVDPVKYRGRRLRSVQLFFAQHRKVHHLNLLLGPDTPQAAPQKALAQLLETFRPVTPPNPCR